MGKPIVASDLHQPGRVLKGWWPGKNSPAQGEPGRLVTESFNWDSNVAAVPARLRAES